MNFVELTRISENGLAFGVCIDPNGIDYITVPNEGYATGTIICLCSGQTIAVSENYNNVLGRWKEARGGKRQEAGK